MVWDVSGHMVTVDVSPVTLEGGLTMRPVNLRELLRCLSCVFKPDAPGSGKTSTRDNMLLSSGSLQ